MSEAIGASPRTACTFCGKPGAEVDHLVSGPGVHICDGCVELCVETIRSEQAAATPASGLEPLRPRDVRGALDEYVVGQNTAKRALSVAVYNHYKRVNESGRPAALSVEDAEVEDPHIELAKSNVLVLGPTGSGKTLLAQTLARILRVPFVSVDATGLTETGYMGDDVDSILLKLLQAADHDISRAEAGIVYIDEIDKIARHAEGSGGKDVSGEGVQQGLLRMLEGTIITIDPQNTGGGVASGTRSRTRTQAIRIDTSGVLFVLGGAFPGLEKTVESRLGRSGIGFTAHRPADEAGTADPLTAVVHEDLTDFGMLAEFVGRLPVITSVHHLDMPALRRVLTEPRNAIVRQYRRLFQLDGVDLVFTEDALQAVAEQALRRRTGARGLRAIIEDVLVAGMYDVPSLEGVARVVVTREAVQSDALPELQGRDGTAITWAPTI